MTMSRPERLAYQRGYSRGRANLVARVKAVIQIARGYQKREPDQVRRCDGCARWTRGSPTRCIWGRCRGDFESGLEPRMWADRFSGEHLERAIITTEDFACVNFLPM